ncbi:MAG: hypothetical protein RLZZ68_168, partial [Bacteroidota bacterium]
PNHEMIYTTNGKMAKLIKESSDPMADYALGIAEIGSIKAKDGSDLYYRMVKPSNFDPRILTRIRNTPFWFTFTVVLMHKW